MTDIVPKIDAQSAQEVGRSLGDIQIAAGRLRGELDAVTSAYDRAREAQNRFSQSAPGAARAFAEAPGQGPASAAPAAIGERQARQDQAYQAALGGAAAAATAGLGVDDVLKALKAIQKSRKLIFSGLATIGLTVAEFLNENCGGEPGKLSQEVTALEKKFAELEELVAQRNPETASGNIDKLKSLKSDIDKKFDEDTLATGNSIARVQDLIDKLKKRKEAANFSDAIAEFEKAIAIVKEKHEARLKQLTDLKEKIDKEIGALDVLVEATRQQPNLKGPLPPPPNLKPRPPIPLRRPEMQREQEQLRRAIDAVIDDAIKKMYEDLPPFPMRKPKRAPPPNPFPSDPFWWRPEMIRDEKDLRAAVEDTTQALGDQRLAFEALERAGEGVITGSAGDDRLLGFTAADVAESQAALENQVILLDQAGEAQGRLNDQVTAAGPAWGEVIDELAEKGGFAGLLPTPELLADAEAGLSAFAGTAAERFSETAQRLQDGLGQTILDIFDGASPKAALKNFTRFAKASFSGLLQDLAGAALRNPIVINFAQQLTGGLSGGLASLGGGLLRGDLAGAEVV